LQALVLALSVLSLILVLEPRISRAAKWLHSLTDRQLIFVLLAVQASALAILSLLAVSP